jgi:hypothetical protein
MACEGISFAILMLRCSIDFLVKLGEKLTLVDLLFNKVFSSHEILKVLVVSDHCNKVGSASELCVPTLKNANNC